MATPSGKRPSSALSRRPAAALCVAATLLLAGGAYSVLSRGPSEPFRYSNNGDSLADAVLEEEAQARTRREAPMMRHVLMQRDGNARRQLTTTTHFAARPGPSRLPLVAVPMAYLNGSTVSQPPLGAAAPEGEDVLVLVATGGSDSIHVGSRNAVRDTWGTQIDVRYVTSETDIPDALAMRLAPGEDAESRMTLTRKTMHMLKHTATEGYMEDYGFFFKADDDTFINAPALRDLIAHLDPDVPLHMGTPDGPRVHSKNASLLKATMGDPFNGINNVYFCHGGGGYIVSRGLLRELEPHLTSVCLESKLHYWEDTAMSVCARVVTGANQVLRNRRMRFDPIQKHNRHDQPYVRETISKQLLNREKKVMAQFYTQHPIKESLMHWLYDIYKGLYANKQVVNDAYILRRKELSESTLAFNRRWRCNLPRAPAHVGFCFQNALRPWARKPAESLPEKGTPLRPFVGLSVLLRHAANASLALNASNSAVGSDTLPSPANDVSVTLYPLECERSTPTAATRPLPPPAVPEPEPEDGRWPALPCGALQRQVLVLATHTGAHALTDEQRETLKQQTVLLLRTLTATLAPCPTHVTLLGAGRQNNADAGTAATLAEITRALIPALDPLPSWLSISVLAVEDVANSKQRRLPILLTAAGEYLNSWRQEHDAVGQELMPTLLVPLDTIFQRDPFDLLDGRFTQLTVTTPSTATHAKINKTTNNCGIRPWERGVQVLSTFAMGHAPVVERHLLRLVAFAQRRRTCPLQDMMQPFVWGQISSGAVMETPTFIGGYATTPHVSLREESRLRRDALVRGPDGPAGKARCAVASTAGPAALVMDYWDALRPTLPIDTDMTLAGSQAATLKMVHTRMAPELPATFIPTVISE